MLKDLHRAIRDLKYSLEINKDEYDKELLM